MGSLNCVIIRLMDRSNIMVCYLKQVQAESDRVFAVRDAAREADSRSTQSRWGERLTPLEDRVRKLIAAAR